MRIRSTWNRKVLGAFEGLTVSSSHRCPSGLGAGSGLHRVKVPVEHLLPPPDRRLLGTAATARPNGGPVARAAKRAL